MQYNRIHIVGASGAGTTSLGKALEEKHNYKLIDIDDFYWFKTDPPFISARPEKERLLLIEDELAKQEKWVLTGSLCGWGDVLIPLFDLVIFLDTATDLRIKRISKRENTRFGKRIEKNGDMYENHLSFIEWAKAYDTNLPPLRGRILHEEWFKLLNCPLLRLDGSESIDSLLKQIEDNIFL